MAVAHAHSNEPQSLEAWLSSRGCTFKYCEVTPPTADSASGRAVVVSPSAHPRQLQRRWWHRIWGPGDGWLLATFPLANAITASTATQHPLLGQQFQLLLEQGVLDPRTAVMLLLIVEKMRGEASPYHPWLAALPTRMDTPLHFTEEEVAELRGTALQAATHRQREGLEATWRRLRLVTARLLQQAGVEGEVVLEDFFWAHSVYWSRAQSLPLKGAEGVEVVEAIVPGLDFCNHSLHPTCWWQVQPAGKEEEVQLRAAPGSSMAPGQEASISYGERSNEALLFAYGFALLANPHDAVMVHCPLPPSNQWDDALSMRMRLLQARGLSPRFFLPASSLLPQPGQQAAAAGAQEEEEGLGGLMQQEVGQVLEVFVMPLHRVAAALQQLEAGEESSSSGSSSSGASAGSSGDGSEASCSMDDRLEAAGLQMGVTSTLVRLLELKLIELEGSEGTGRLEKDQRALAAEAGSMPPRRWNCLVYRAEQKRLVREYLGRARVEMSRIMARVDKLQQEADGEKAQ